jgi:hypothetical protein
MLPNIADEQKRQSMPKKFSLILGAIVLSFTTQEVSADDLIDVTLILQCDWTYNVYDGQLSSVPIKEALKIIYQPRGPVTMGDLWLLNADKSADGVAEGVVTVGVTEISGIFFPIEINGRTKKRSLSMNRYTGAARVTEIVGEITYLKSGVCKRVEQRSF